MTQSQLPKSRVPLIIGTVVITTVITVGVFSLGFFGFANNIFNGNPNSAVGLKTQTAEIDLKIKGNKNSRIYHLSGCPNYDDIAERNIRWFKTHEEAKAAGFRMAKNC